MNPMKFSKTELSWPDVWNDSRCFPFLSYFFLVLSQVLCISNQMAMSAIWNKWAHVKTEQLHEPEGRRPIIYLLSLKNLRVFIYTKLDSKPCYYLLITYMQKFHFKFQHSISTFYTVWHQLTCSQPITAWKFLHEQKMSVLPEIFETGGKKWGYRLPARTPMHRRTFSRGLFPRNQIAELPDILSCYWRSNEYSVLQRYRIVDIKRQLWVKVTWLEIPQSSRVNQSLTLPTNQFSLRYSKTGPSKKKREILMGYFTHFCLLIGPELYLHDQRELMAAYSIKDLTVFREGRDTGKLVEMKTVTRYQLSPRFTHNVPEYFRPW